MAEIVVVPVVVERSGWYYEFPERRGAEASYANS